MKALYVSHRYELLFYRNILYQIKHNILLLLLVCMEHSWFATVICVSS